LSEKGEIVEIPIQPAAGWPHPHGAASPTAALRDEHAVILRALALLERLGEALEAGGPVDRERLAWLRGFFGTFTDRCHHAKEERHLFPALERHGIPKEGGPLGVMLEEHEQGRALIRAMADSDDREVAAAIQAYVNLLRGHIYKENEVLLPMAEHVLAGEEKAELARAFETVEEGVADPGAHERIVAELARLESA
jgi:hemerythrin-like domain-containing protein